jgi:glycosyltransferase involved in cell wall biosynthesis
MNNKSLVSVIIPCYKMGGYIAEALDSIGKQAYGKWEVIVVDDCGPEDGTRGIVEAFTANYPEHRVEFIRHKENGGVSRARNTGIHAAGGKYLAFLDPDDFWGSSYLALHVKALDSDSEIAVSYTGARMVDERGADTGQLFESKLMQCRNFPQSLYINCFIIPSAVVARSTSVKSCEGFDEAPSMQHVEDWDLWLRMLKGDMKFVYTSSAECFWRRHSEASTANIAAARSREEVLRSKHREQLDRYSRDLMRMTLIRLDDLDGKQRAFEGSVFFRLGRILSKIFAKLSGK